MDVVRAKRVTIASASILFNDIATSTIAPGTVFTVIDNTGRSAISSVFSNLADRATVTVGNNTFRANYEGGDGNDLTLTVR